MQIGKMLIAAAMALVASVKQEIRRQHAKVYGGTGKTRRSKCWRGINMGAGEPNGKKLARKCYHITKLMGLAQ
jgi:hypothetical protein